MSDREKWIQAVRLASQQMGAEAENEHVVAGFRRAAKCITTEGRVLRAPLLSEVFAELADEAIDTYAREGVLPWWFPRVGEITH